MQSKYYTDKNVPTACHIDIGRAALTDEYVCTGYVPLDTLYVISETIFTGQMTQPTASKHWRKPVGHWHKLKSYQNHSTVLQYEL